MRKAPAMAPMMPVMAQAPAIRQSTVFNFQLVSVPAKVMGIIRAKDVPTATWYGTPQRRVKAGTMMAPPPMPKQPEARPARRPMRA